MAWILTRHVAVDDDRGQVSTSSVPQLDTSEMSDRGTNDVKTLDARHQRQQHDGHGPRAMPQDLIYCSSTVCVLVRSVREFSGCEDASCGTAA